MLALYFFHFPLDTPWVPWGKKEKEEFSLVFMPCNTLGVRRSEVSVPQL
jgi:hypothetical protein